MAGDVSTAFIEEHRGHLFAASSLDDVALAAWLLWQRRARRGAERDEIDDPWHRLTGWRLNHPSREVYWVDRQGDAVVVNLESKSIKYSVHQTPCASARVRREVSSEIDQQDDQSRSFHFDGTINDHGDFSISMGGVTHKGTIAPHHDAMRVFIGADTVDIATANPLQGDAGTASVAGSLSAPMPGTVTALVKTPGDRAEAGETLLVMEAMKMEHAIKAPHAGKVAAFRFDVGQQVTEGALLVEFEAE